MMLKHANMALAKLYSCTANLSAIIYDWINLIILIWFIKWKWLPWCLLLNVCFYFNVNDWGSKSIVETCSTCYSGCMSRCVLYTNICSKWRCHEKWYVDASIMICLSQHYGMWMPALWLHVPKENDQWVCEWM